MNIKKQKHLDFHRTGKRENKRQVYNTTKNSKKQSQNTSPRDFLKSLMFTDSTTPPPKLTEDVHR